jgi:hypothetical protein
VLNWLRRWSFDEVISASLKSRRSDGPLPELRLRRMPAVRGSLHRGLDH